MWDAIGFSKIFTVLTCGISASSRVYSPTSEMERCIPQNPKRDWKKQLGPTELLRPGEAWVMFYRGPHMGGMQAFRKVVKLER